VTHVHDEIASFVLMAGRFQPEQCRNIRIRAARARSGLEQRNGGAQIGDELLLLRVALVVRPRRDDLELDSQPRPTGDDVRS
jgi:hypothetical protein